MKQSPPLFLLSTLCLFFAAPQIAAAKCPDAVGTDYASSALAQFRCSSARDLKGTAGEREFAVDLNFPTTQPAAVKLPWKAIEFEKQPEAYIRSLLSYGVKDNAEVDWRIEDNKNSKWCHAPWYQNQRERLRGMTSERGSRKKELHELQTTQERNWAVGFYNEIGCYALGQVWKDPGFPKTKDFAFQDGAFSIKLLFTTASPRNVPYLTGSKEWNAAINNDGSVETMRLLQVDVAVKDSRAANPSGWIFGTFIYDAYAPGETVWEKLVPVGLMWGNDPDLTSAAYEERGVSPEEGWINPYVAEKFYRLPRHNLGLHGRLNGPVDNPKAACLGCHGRALDWGRSIPRGTPVDEEAKLLLPLAPNPYDEPGVKRYFRNLGATEPFVSGTQPLDFSLQLAGGISNFRSWVSQSFPSQAANTTDVPPYKFEVEKAPPGAPAIVLFLNSLRQGASDLAAGDRSGSFVRGED